MFKNDTFNNIGVCELLLNKIRYTLDLVNSSCLITPASSDSVTGSIFNSSNLIFFKIQVLQLVKLLLFIITDENLPVEFWDSKLTAARILTQLCRYYCKRRKLL